MRDGAGARAGTGTGSVAGAGAGTAAPTGRAAAPTGRAAAPTGRAAVPPDAVAAGNAVRAGDAVAAGNAVAAGGVSPVAACCWGLLTTVVLPGSVLYSADTAGTALFVQCVVVLHTGGALAWTLAGARLRLMAFGFWLFSYIWFGLAPLAMLATDSYPLGFRVDAATAVTACAVVEAGLLAYSAGAVLAGCAARRRSVVLEPLLARRVTPMRLLLLCLAALLLAAALIPGQGGIGTFFESRQAVNETAQQVGDGETAGRAVASWALSAPAFWALLACLHVPRRRGGDQLLRGLRRLLLPLLLALNTIVNNPVSQPRFWAGTVLLTLLFSAPALRRPRAFRAATALILLVVLVVFPYADYFRNDKREPVQVVSLAEQFTQNGDYDAYQQLQTAVSLQQDAGFAPRMALGPPLFFVPRAVWPGKPDDTGIRLARHAGYRFDNLSAPLWAESYLWAGFPAVVAVLGLYGALGRRIDDVRHRLRRGSGTLAVLVVPALAFFQLILLRGSLLASMGPLTLLVLVALLVSSRRGYGDARKAGAAGEGPGTGAGEGAAQGTGRGSRATVAAGPAGSRRPHAHRTARQQAQHRGDTCEDDGHWAASPRP